MSACYRPMPSDFHDVALSMSGRACRLRYGIGWQMFRRWCGEAGISEEIKARQGVPIRPHQAGRFEVPSDFAQLAPLQSTAKLALHYMRSVKLIERWRREAKIPAPRNLTMRQPAPDGFALVAPTMYRTQLAKQYGVGDMTAQRWADEAGVSFKPWQRRKTGLPTAMSPQADMSIAGRAAQHLQRVVPVYKAAVIDRKLDGYVVAGRKMSTEDMIAMAAKRGFDADAWRRI